MPLKWLAVIPAIAILWVAKDLTISNPAPLTRFDGRQVGRLETAMWRSYYRHERVQLFAELFRLLRSQYHLPYAQACLAAWHAARAAVVFQRGHNRGEYESALPDLRAYYAIIRRSSDTPFSVERVAPLELEWWIVHRERAAHRPGDLEGALAASQAALFQRPVNLFQRHAADRAAAMALCDAAQASGGGSDEDWRQIARLLDSSWVSLQQAVAQP